MIEPEPKRTRGQRIATPSSQLLNEARTRLTRAREMAVTLKLAKDRNELIPKSLVQSQAAHLVVALRSKILTVPQTYSRRLLGITDREEMAAKLKTIMLGLLKELQDLPHVVEQGWVDRSENQETSGRKELLAE